MDYTASKSHLIFDFDGTIATLKIDWDAWHPGVGEIFRIFEPEFDLDKKGEQVHFYRNDFARKYGKECRDKVAEFSERYELNHFRGLEPNEKVLNIIRGASDKKLFLWTSNSKKLIESCLRGLNIRNKFEKLITSDDVFFVKPDPEGFSLISKDSPLSKYVFFGDSAFDQGAASTIGIEYVDVEKL